MNTPERIKQLLKDAGVEERKVTRVLADLCGVTPQAVAQWFNGSTRRISPEYLKKIAIKYKTSTDWLIDGQGEMLPVLDLLNVRESDTRYGNDPLSEITENFPKLSKAGQYAVLSTLHREMEKAEQNDQ